MTATWISPEEYGWKLRLLWTNLLYYAVDPVPAHEWETDPASETILITEEQT